MKSVALTAFPRTLSRRAGAKKLRLSGRVPAVIYGGHADQPQSLEIPHKEFKDLMHHCASEIVLLDLSVHGDPKPRRLALVQEIQHHVLSGAMLHVDLHEVAENEKVTVMVPIEPAGEAIGVKTGGGVLEHVLHKLKVRALPKDLPEVIYVDVSTLEIGKSIHLGEIKPPEGVEILGDKKVSVLAVAAPISEAQEAAEAAATAATPSEVEMLKEKKEDGTEGEAKPAAKGGDKAAPAAADKKAEKKK